MRLLIANATDYHNRTHVWQLLDQLKPTDVIVRNQPGVDTYAFEWATRNHVRSVRAPLSSLPKHLMGHKPDAILCFGAGRDAILTRTIDAAKRLGVRVIPVAY